MTSCLLFHGPGARDGAVRRAQEIGRLLIPPVGDEGLKTDVARSLVEWMQMIPVGDRIGCLVIGPLDGVPSSATHALLKTLEEFDSRLFRPILWADDAGEVSATIRSRSLIEWCPEGEPPKQEILDVAHKLHDVSLKGETAQIIETLSAFKGESRELLRAVAYIIAQKLEPASLSLWLSLRDTLSTAYPSKTEILGTFLPRGKK